MNLVIFDLSFSLFYRAWLSNTRLNSVKYKIVIFKPELLNGKISKDPQTPEAAKPVRQLQAHTCCLHAFPTS